MHASPKRDGGIVVPGNRKHHEPLYLPRLTKEKVLLLNKFLAHCPTFPIPLHSAPRSLSAPPSFPKYLVRGKTETRCFGWSGQVLKACKERQLYATPRLNENLYLQVSTAHASSGGGRKEDPR
eukprot:2843981-Rhodomonas_salina.1